MTRPCGANLATLKSTGTYDSQAAFGRRTGCLRADTCACVQTIAFVHGHQHSWHSLDMLENLRALRWDLVTQHRDLNRIMPVWTHRVGALNATPEAFAVAELPDSYNGSYNVNQVRGCRTGV